MVQLSNDKIYIIVGIIVIVIIAIYLGNVYIKKTIKREFSKLIKKHKREVPQVPPEPNEHMTNDNDSYADLAPEPAERPIG